MNKTRETFLMALLMTAVLSAPAAAASLKRPADLSVQAPGSEVPTNCASFSGGWTDGEWKSQNGNRPGELWVEQIGKDCSATVVYMWGAHSRFGGSPDFRRLAAKVDGERLVVPLVEFKAQAIFRRNGETLLGDWSNGDPSAASSIVLKRAN